MGLFSSIKKGLKKVFKPVTKIVKGVVKRVKKVGKKVWEGAKDLLGKVGKAFGKLGPIGTIALSFMLPGLGTAFSAAWGNAATWLTGTGQNAFFRAVGEGMKYMSKVGGYFKDSISKVSDAIGKTFSDIGGNITDGANKFFESAQRFAGSKDPASIQDVGKWVTDKARSLTGQPATPSPAQAADLTNVPGRYAAPQQADSLFPALETQAPPVPQQGTFPLQTSVEQQAASMDAFNATQAERMFPTVQDPFSPGIAKDLPTEKPSGFSDRMAEAVKKSASSLLGGIGGPATMPQQAMFQPVQAATTATGRGGIGGTGAGGGQFLSEQQMAAIQAFNKQLEAMG